MTEDEAKTRWCPFIRFTDCDERLYDNRPSHLQDGAFCVGSACMAWRWTIKPGPDHRAGIAEHGPSGYCGLAGRPA